jgi:hypothetical protein
MSDSASPTVRVARLILGFARVARALLYRLGWYLRGLPVDDENPYGGWRWLRYRLGTWLCEVTKRPT